MYRGAFDMKKWLLILFIVVLPMIVFYFFDLKKGTDTSSLELPAALAANKPTVYRFSSSMCMDCQELEKVMKEVEPKYSDKIVFYSFKVDRANKNVKEKIKKYNISLVPTMILIDKNGKETLKIEGFVEKPVLEKHFKALSNE